MANLLNTISETLRSKLSAYNVTQIFIEYGEVNVVSEFDMDNSYYSAIEKELIQLEII